MTHTSTPDCQSSNATRIQGAVIIGLLAGYAVLAALLFIFGDDPVALLEHNAPYLIVLGVSLFAAAGPLFFAKTQNRFRMKSGDFFGLCADGAMTPQRLIGVTGLGFVLGALLHQTIRLFFG